MIQYIIHYSEKRGGKYPKWSFFHSIFSFRKGLSLIETTFFCYSQTSKPGHSGMFHSRIPTFPVSSCHRIGDRGGLFGPDTVGKTLQKVGDGFFDCSIARITFRRTFGGLFCGERCILTRRTAFGGLCRSELHNPRIQKNA
jgi:hypothetical protein